MLELHDLPRRLDRRLAAQVVSVHFFPVSPRTLERWPLTWRRINGRALADTEELLAEAQRRVDAAPAVRGGQS
jgi:hypothetical protein